MQLHEVEVVSFLTDLFSRGESYSAINSARSALSAILCNDNGVTIGKFNSVKRFMKGVFEQRPPMPRYSTIWDANTVLNYLKVFYPYDDLPLSQLTYKIVMLLALASSQRAQTLHAINVKDVIFYDNLVEIPIFSLLKQTTARNRKFVIRLKSFEQDYSLCVVQILRVYIERTARIRTGDQLFISYQKPHNVVSKETISRWLKLVLFEAGIDVSHFKAHITRAASVSRAKKDSVNVNEILQAAGWSNSRTFHRFYDKVIVS